VGTERFCPHSVTSFEDLFSHENQQVARPALANERSLSATIEPSMALNQRNASRKNGRRSSQPAPEESYNFNAATCRITGASTHPSC
jgi:hypothetical protein